MQNLKSSYFNPFFSHIYVEKRVRKHPRTQKILSEILSHASSNVPGDNSFVDQPGNRRAEIIQIDHYKDVFCRKGQSSRLQRRTQNLILAAKEGNFFYPGAEVCQNFGRKNFYYTSCVMNCIYDCAYCYLKGMYPSGNIVIFVNIEDIFHAAQQMLRKAPMYVCVSYDTDLLALEKAAGYAGEWHRFAGAHEEELVVEIRTKCADKHFFQNHKPVENVIYAFTLSPAEVIKAHEHHTPPLSQRIACITEAVERGFPVRLCFDPMIYVSGWRRCYREMLDEVFSSVDAGRIVDVSVGSFRIPRDYLKNMRKQEPDSAAVWFPYEQENGICHYPSDIMEQMESYLSTCLKEKLPGEKIFLWKQEGQG